MQREVKRTNLHQTLRAVKIHPRTAKNLLMNQALIIFKLRQLMACLRLRKRIGPVISIFYLQSLRLLKANWMVQSGKVYRIQPKAMQM